MNTDTASARALSSEVSETEWQDEGEHESESDGEREGCMPLDFEEK